MRASVECIRAPRDRNRKNGWGADSRGTTQKIQLDIFGAKTFGSTVAADYRSLWGSYAR